MRRFLATAALLASFGAPAPAQPAGAVEGVARADSGNAPVPFALVRLLGPDSTVSAQGVTTADGRFRFSSVAAGRYRVQLLRIGFRPVLSDLVQVAAGETAQLPLRVAAEPLPLPAMTVGGGECVTRDVLAQHPALLTLWQQARDGAAIHEGLMARFRYRTLAREEGVQLQPDGPTPPHPFEQTWVSEPRRALADAARSRALRLARGYAGPNDGWAENGEPRGTLRIVYDDVAFAGGTLRMPVGGSYHMWPSNRDRKKETQGTLTFTYAGFAEVPPR